MDEECNVDVLLLKHEPPEDFGECMCQSSNGASLAYIALRDLLSICNFSIFIASIIVSLLDKKLKLYIFFDFWTQALLFISSEFGMLSIVQIFYENAEDYDEFYWEYMPWTCKVYWALISAVLPSTVVSFVYFWSQLFYKKIHILHILMNTVSPALAFVEFMFVAFPLRFLHFFYFVLFYIIYVLFTLTYQKLGGTGVDGLKPIYKLIDWNRPEKAFLFCSAGLGIGLGAYFLFCFISMMKMACKHRGDYF